MTCCEWWIDHIKLFHDFLEQGENQGKDNQETLAQLLKKDGIAGKVASMQFAVSHTAELVKLIELALKVSVCYNEVKQQAEGSQLKAPVEEALAKIPKSADRDKLSANFMKALRKVSY